MAHGADSPAHSSLDQLNVWVFDLDNTLYPATASLFPQIDVRMKRFIATSLGIPEDEAFLLQKRYYHEYGTTLRGLMLRHAIEPESFLAYVHAIDHSVLTPDPALRAGIERLPGRKLVFTNGSERHAVDVLRHLDLTETFEGIFDIRAAGYVPKPNLETYWRMVRQFGFDPERAAMFEDSPKNLVPAADIGMTTVWVRPAAADTVPWFVPLDEDVSHCHHVTDDLSAWLARVV
ncbi:MAG: pyrimidine 5'-nucleotidase [Alphaproteobacteria bacterium]